MRNDTQDITAWLNELGQDTDTDKGTGVHAPSVGNALFSWLYDDLHRVARPLNVQRRHAGRDLIRVPHEAQ